MLYIENRISKPVAWRIGERKHRFEPGCVISVEADGDELIYIRRFFSNLLDNADEDWIIWRGESAQFIVDNL